MFKFKIFVVIFFLLTTFYFLHSTVVSAVSESDCLNKSVSELSEGDMNDCINNVLPRIASAYAPAQEQNKANLANLKKQIDSLNNRIVSISKELTSKENDIKGREKDVDFAQSILNEKAVSQYITARLYDPLISLISAKNALEAFKTIKIKEMVAEGDRKTIEKYSEEIKNLKKDKENLEKNKISLASLQKKVSEDAKFLEGEVGKVETFLSVLSSKQQELLAAKFASAPVPLLAYTSLGGCSSDMGKDPGFSPRFGLFSYGVPNKTGMNQYGAKGRAEAGQNYTQILEAYYRDFQIVDYGTSFNITVKGTNEYGQVFSNETMNIEDYLKHLYEMPTMWHPEALKAQAIAARSYALARTNNGQNTIPPNQSGQVVKKELNSSEWINAVNATSGKVMTQGNSPISAWYSSTHGGVVLSSGQIGWNNTSWTKQTIDTPSGSVGSFTELRANAFDRQSPWFHCDWGYRSEYNKTAWLKTDEVLDITNSFMLWQIDNSMISHLSQTDKPTAETWSSDKVRQELQNKGGTPMTSVGSIEVVWDSSGISRTININGKSFDAQKFKNLFNIRAPANIQIKPTCLPPDLKSDLTCSKMYALYDVVKE